MTKIGGCLERYSKDCQYRLAKHVISANTENGTILLYNALTKEIVEILDDENVFCDYMLNEVFIVPKDFVDWSLAMTVREFYEQQREDTITPLSYTIFTTTACNARCFYCYEKNKPQKPMSEKTAKDVAEFISKNYYDSKDIHDAEDLPVVLSWFGGEPLFRKKCIDIICEELRKNGVPFKSKIVTNGYLFNEKTIDTANKSWNVKGVQITLDGTGEVYNETKKYIYQDPNPFNTVLNNISNLSRSSIYVSIRINVGMFNLTDADHLVDLLCDKFHGNRNVGIYLHGLFDNSENDTKTKDDINAVFQKISSLEKVIFESGLGPAEKNFSNSYSKIHCMADSGTHLCILTDGRLTLCEHFSNENEIGTIYDFPEKINLEMVSKYKEVRKPFTQCYDCPLLVSCSYLKICDSNGTDCTEARKAYLISHFTKKIFKKYKQIKDSEQRLKKYIDSKNKGTD